MVDLTKSFLLALPHGSGSVAYYWNAINSDTHKFPVGGDATIAVEARFDAFRCETHVIDCGNGRKKNNVVISIGYSHHLRERLQHTYDRAVRAFVETAWLSKNKDKASRSSDGLGSY